MSKQEKRVMDSSIIKLACPRTVRQGNPFEIVEGKLYANAAFGKIKVQAPVDTQRAETLISEGFAYLLQEKGRFKERTKADRYWKSLLPPPYEDQTFTTDIAIGDTILIGVEMVVDYHNTKFLKIGTDLLQQIGANISFGRL